MFLFTVVFIEQGDDYYNGRGEISLIQQLFPF